MNDLRVALYITVQRWALDRLPGMTETQITRVIRVLEELVG